MFDGASVVSGSAPTTLDDFMAIDDANFRGGVRIALGDINANGIADLVVGAGYGGDPRVAAYDGASLGQGEQVKLFADLFAFEDGLRNGVYVGVGDANGDGCGDLLFGAGPGGGPRVGTFSGNGTLLTLAGQGTTPTTAAADATVSLTVTDATLDSPRSGSTDTNAYGATLSGTLTVTRDGADPITLAFTATSG